jgi:predicted molibdopterin-dependent oxidoreductase YjgC
LLDTLANRLTAAAESFLPVATWIEKAGCFENAKGRLQSFERAIQPVDFAKCEGQIALDLAMRLSGGKTTIYDADQVRSQMALVPGLAMFCDQVHHPPVSLSRESDMVTIDL